jgi:nascent polypeptide-associated complex subunit beta
MDQEVLDARAKLAARFGNNQLGGKGTQRRTKKVVHHQEVNEDKKLKSTIKKFGMQSLQDIDEVNMFKDDNTVIHLKRPQTQFSVRENLLVVAGTPETKELKDMLPDILKQVGPQQYQFLKSTLGNLEGGKEAAADDDVPDLVGTFEDAGKK